MYTNKHITTICRNDYKQFTSQNTLYFKNIKK